jgi:O-antigen/teichoic acid export membrane protein
LSRDPETAPPESSEEPRLSAIDDAAVTAGTPAAPELNAAALGARAIVQLSVRTVATRAITLIGTIALARLLTPDQFGAFAVISLFVTLISVVGDFGIGPALIQQARTPSAIEVSTAFVAQMALWTTIAAIVWLAAGVIPALRPELPPEAPVIARLLAVGLLLSGLRSIPTIMLTRVLRFGPLAAIEVVQQILYFGAAVVLAAAGFGVSSFAVAVLVYGVVGTIAVYAVWRHWPGLRFDPAIARRLLRFGLGYQIGYVLNLARDAVIPAFGGVAGGLAAVGILGFAWRNGQLVTAIELIASRVAFPAFSRMQSDAARIASAAALLLEVTLLAVCAIQGWIVATAPVLVPVVFSDTWTPAVAPLQLVCIGSLAGAPISVLRSYLYARGESRRASLLSAISLVVFVGGFIALATNLGLSGAALSFVLSAGLSLALFISATASEITFPWRTSLRILVGTLVASAIAWVAVRAVGGVGGLAVSGVLYVAVGLAELWLLEPGLLKRTRAILRSAT